MNDRTWPRLLIAILAVTLALGAAWPSIAEAQVSPKLGGDPEAGQPEPEKKKKKSTKKKRKKKKSGAKSRRSSKDRSSKKKGRGRGSKKGDLKPFPKGPREDEFRKYLGEEYKVRREDHFFVMYNADEEIVKQFILRLERTYKSVHWFARKSGIEINYPEEKLPVIFCCDFEEYDRRCKQITGRGVPSNAAGLYWRHPLNFSIFYDMSQVGFVKEQTARARRLQEEARTTRDRAQRKAKVREAQWVLNRIEVYQETNNRSVVQHEVAHQLLFNFQVHTIEGSNPQWFVEGLATQFEPPPGKMGAGFSVTNQRRLRTIHSSFDRQAPDLRDFVGNPSREGGMLSEEGYALSWALTYYLTRKKRKQLPQYIQLIKKRKAGLVIAPETDVADFEKCFGKIDRAFQKKWWKFIRSLPYRPPQ